MLIGGFEMNGLSLPARFREVWGRSLLLATSTCKEEICLILFPNPSLIHNGQLADFYFWGSVKVDKRGKIRIPRWMLKKLPPSLKPGKEGKVVVVGCIDYIEIWRQEEWDKRQKVYNFVKMYTESLERLGF